MSTKIDLELNQALDMEDSCVVIDVEEYARKKFLDRFKLDEYCEIPIRVNKIEKLDPVRDMHFEEYNIDIKLSSLLFNLSIIVSQYEKDQFIRKISINIDDDRFKEELQSCINHIQRRRNLNYAIEQLLSYVLLFKQRQRILSYLGETSNEVVKIDHDNEEGFLIEYSNPLTKYMYFKANWKIWWNCRNFSFFDYINFAVNKENEGIYGSVKKYMVDILQPTTDYEKKLTNWTLIFNCIKYDIGISVLAEGIDILNASSGSNNNNNFDYIDGPIEISDSDSEVSNCEDDDVCIVSSTGKHPKQLTIVD